MSNFSRRTLLSSLSFFFLPNLVTSSPKEEQLQIKWELFPYSAPKKEYFSQFTYKGHSVTVIVEINIEKKLSSIFFTFYIKGQFKKRVCINKIGIETLDLEDLTLEVKKMVKDCL